mgnify:FL=1
MLFRTLSAGRDSSTTLRSTARSRSTRASGSHVDCSLRSPTLVSPSAASCSIPSALSSSPTASPGELSAPVRLVSPPRRLYAFIANCIRMISESQLHRELASGVSFPIGPHFPLSMALPRRLTCLSQDSRTEPMADSLSQSTPCVPPATLTDRKSVV